MFKFLEIPKIDLVFVLGAVFFLLPETSLAQVYVQKYRVEKLSFQYRSNNLSDTRCLKWFPLRADYKPPVEYTKKGEPYLTVQIKARIEDKCPLTLEQSARIKELPSPKVDQKIFQITLTPPVTVVSIEGPGFVDELVLEAPLREFEDVGFFKYFSKSQVYFDLKYLSLSTNNPTLDDDGFFQPANRNSKLFPVLGGLLTLPLPWFENIFVGMGISQNLGTALPSQDIPTQLSEIAFDLRYSYTGKESRGRPSLSAILDFRGRNLYQTGTSEEKPFLLGSITLAGGGIDGAYYFWPINWGPRLGISASSRFYPYGVVGGRRLSSYIIEGALNFRLDKKWALGFGYSRTFNYVSTPEYDDVGGAAQSFVSEPVTSYFLRLSLVPFIETRKSK
jgi:hypothetical protein